MLSTIIFRAIILFLPSQLGLHLWPEYSRILGLKIDYLSPTIYLSQLLVFLLLVINYKKLLFLIKKQNYFFKFLFLFSTLNTVFSLNPSITLYRWIEIFIFILLFLYISNSKKIFEKNINYLYISLCLVLFLQTYQLLNQRSFDGIFYWLGERHFTQTTPSMPKLQIFGQEIIRVPSTFSHSNSLAGFMLLSLVFLKQLNKNKWPRVIALISIILSGSKNAILSLPLYFAKKMPLRKIAAASISFTLFLILISPISNNYGYTISSRLDGIGQSLKVITHNSVLGTGLGAYINGLALNMSGSETIYENLQPVHNLYLLVFSEVGLIGLFVLYITLKTVKISTKQSLILSVVLLTGLFDHYWLTLIQNKILLTILLASFPVEYEA